MTKILFLFLALAIIYVVVRVLKRLFRTSVWDESQLQFLSELTFEQMLEWCRDRCNTIIANKEEIGELSLLILPNASTLELLNDSSLSSRDKKNAYYVIIQDETNKKIFFDKFIVTKVLPNEFREAFQKGNYYKIPIEF